MKALSTRATSHGARRPLAPLLVLLCTLPGMILFSRVPASPVQAAGVLLSQNQPTVASSVEAPRTDAAYAVDGKATTRWGSQFSDPQWIYVDLGRVAAIDHVVLRWETAYGKQYQIQVSDDAASWTTIYAQSHGAGGVETLNVHGSGRYVRLYCTRRGTGYGYSLWEFQVYGSAGAPGPAPTTVPTAPATPPASSGTLVWSDEFNGPAGATPSASTWTPDIGGGGYGNHQLEYDTNNNNARMDGKGALVIEARKETPAKGRCWYGPCAYTSARITTQNKVSFTYGRIEARLKVPYGQGLWPAFWLLGANYKTVSWPGCGEIDIMENIGREPGTVHGTVHGPGYARTNSLGRPYTLPNNHAFSSAYHVFAVQWNADSVSYSVDNVTYHTVTRALAERHGQWVFNHPFFIILNVAVGGDWPGRPDATTVFPQLMHVDYVRVYH